MNNQLKTLLSDLVAIDSINPDLVSGAAGEAEIADFIAQWMENAGLEVYTHESAPGRNNVAAIARGSGGGKTLLLNGHMDTVGIEGMKNPHSPDIRAGRLYGRGAFDTKGGLAACMLAASKAKKLSLRGDVIFSAVVDEEYAGIGATKIAELYKADGAIVAEPTYLQLIIAHKGYVWLEIETTGIAAHGSRPDLGVDAIMKMGHVLIGLEALQKTLKNRPPHPLLGHASLHASVIKGGRELSTYPERCVLSLERRTLPGETPELIKAELENAIHHSSNDDGTHKAVVRTGLFRSAFETPEDADIVQAVKAANTDVLNFSPMSTGLSYCTDAATLWEAGIPCVLFGPSGAGAHALEEWVELESVETCLNVYLETIKAFCA
ncbi:MAG: ArgE/DapE family deacylase [Anaerolineales bacterium]|nr:ArgE/DapE family deacylase [Anaerolineales bacterium]